MMGRRFPLFVVGLALCCAGLAAADEDAASCTIPDLRLVHVRDGLRGMAPRGDLARLSEASIHKTAKAAGVDLDTPSHPLVVHHYANGRLFYVFYKTTENAFGDRPYLIQRIKKTQRAWRTAEDTEPETIVTWQVEVFKTLSGTFKQADQHYGSYGIREYHRREIVKEYEVGFGEVPGVCEGTDWPWTARGVFQMLQKYQPDAGLYDEVVFRSSRAWTLTVTMGADGAYEVSSPELGFDAPTRLPSRADVTPPPDEVSRELVLHARRGVGDLVIGESTGDDVRTMFGAPLEDTAVGRGHRNVSVGPALTFNLHPDGKLNTILTRPGFSGRTAEGVGHGDTRASVMERMGVPRGQAVDAWQWRYDGVLFRFDGFDRVMRIVVFRR